MEKRLLSEILALKTEKGACRLSPFSSSSSMRQSLFEVQIIISYPVFNNRKKLKEETIAVKGLTQPVETIKIFKIFLT